MRLPLGALCDACRGEIEARAGRIARWVAGLSTLVLAVYVWRRLPPDAAAVQRVVGVVSVVIWYVLTHLVVRRVFREYLR